MGGLVINDKNIGIHANIESIIYKDINGYLDVDRNSEKIIETNI